MPAAPVYRVAAVGNVPSVTGSSMERSRVELLKEGSRHLRGTIVEELALEGPAFSKETVQILKFHGIYQQDDRDSRKQAEVRYGSMVRVGIPGGVLTPDQYLVLDRLADEVGDGSLRITARQDIQFHRVEKAELRHLLRALNENLLSTLAACGDVVRNVTCCPAPSSEARRNEVLQHARALSARLKPKTRAYYEIWIEGEKAAAAETAESEPLYGNTYLPRKFKVGFAAPGDNCIDVYADDVGIVPVYGPSGLEGFTLLAGGGLGMSPGAKGTFPRLADPLCTVEPEQLGDVVEAVVALHRDYGNRANRKYARLKYLVEEWGIERFRAEVENRAGRPLAPPAPLAWMSGDDHLGWHEEGGSRWFLGVRVFSGRVRDEGGENGRSGLREAVRRFRPGVRLTPQQNLLLTGIATEDRDEIDRMLRSFGIRPAAGLPPIVRQAMSCPALPTCGLAITEAERVFPGVLGDIRGELAAAGLDGEAVTVRMTGCPNGCARPYTAEIGIVGQSVNLYGIYLGGSRLGTRLGFLFAGNVPRDQIGARLRPVFESWRENRQAGEPFGDFCHRAGLDALQALGFFHSISERNT